MSFPLYFGGNGTQTQICSLVGALAVLVATFGSVESSHLVLFDLFQPNYVNICTCLDILSFLLTILRKDQILVAFKPLQKSIATWSVPYGPYNPYTYLAIHL